MTETKSGEQKPTLLSVLVSIKERDATLLSAWQEQFEKKTQDDDEKTLFIPSLDFFTNGAALVLDKQVLVERDENGTQETWPFAVLTQNPDNFSASCSPEANLAFEVLASKLGVDLNCVLDAAIKTKILAQDIRTNPSLSESLFVGLGGEKEEGLRLKKITSATLSGDGKIGSLDRFQLDFYCSLNLGKKPLYYLLAHVDLPEVDFISLFPRVLFFSSFVFMQDVPFHIPPVLNSQNPAGELDKGKN